MTSEHSAAEPVAAEVDGAGIRLAAGITDVVDVYFGEHRIWSINPLRFTADEDETRSLPWPPALKQRLRGRTEVSIRRHLTQEVLSRLDVAFEGSTLPLQLVDDDGNWLTLNKWRQLAPAFGEAGVGDRRALVVAVGQLLDAINDGTPLHAFVAYGTLLGAVRSGALLSHDDDVDIGYLADVDNPADLLRESFALQRFLRRQGSTVARNMNGFLAVELELPSGGHAHVDVFSAHFSGGKFYLERWVSGNLLRRHILPLGQVELEGLHVAAPREPEALLASNYGSSWRIPDPSFKYRRSRPLAEHLDRWVGGAGDRRRWNRYYGAGADPRLENGDFADWVLTRLPEGAAVLDLGCGCGHDAVHYSASGCSVLGVDCSSEAIEQAVARVKANATTGVRFETFSVTDLRLLLVHGARFALEHPGPRAVTARLLLDALPPELRRNVWWLARTILLGTDGSLFLEMREADGIPAGHREDAPWATRVDVDRVVDEITAHGGRLEESISLPAEVGADVGKRAGTVRMRVSWPAPV